MKVLDGLWFPTVRHGGYNNWMARLMRHSKAVECAVRWTSSVSVVERRRQHADMLLLRAGRLGKEMLIFKRDWRRNACQWRAERRAGTHTHTHTHTHMSTCPYLSYIKTYEFVSQKTTPRHSGKLSGFHSAVERFVFLTRAGSWRRKLRYDAVYNACRRLTGKAVFKVKIKLRNRDSGGSMRVRCPLCTRQLRRKHYVLSVRPSVRSSICPVRFCYHDISWTALTCQFLMRVTRNIYYSVYWWPDRFFWATRFLFLVFPVFFVLVPSADCHLVSFWAHVNVSYRTWLDSRGQTSRSHRGWSMWWRWHPRWSAIFYCC